MFLLVHSTTSTLLDLSSAISVTSLVFIVHQPTHLLTVLPVTRLEGTTLRKTQLLRVFWAVQMESMSQELLWLVLIAMLTVLLVVY